MHNLSSSLNPIRPNGALASCPLLKRGLLMDQLVYLTICQYIRSSGPCKQNELLCLVVTRPYVLLWQSKLIKVWLCPILLNEAGYCKDFTE